MLFLAYLFPIAAIAWAFAHRKRSGLQGLSPASQELVRVCLFTLALVGVVGSAWGLQQSLGEEGEEGIYAWLPPVLFGCLILGAALYAAGVLVWRGSVALSLRRLGWILAVTPLAVPSTLTLALPVAAVLVLGLENLPRRHSASPSAASA